MRAIHPTLLLSLVMTSCGGDEARFQFYDLATNNSLQGIETRVEGASETTSASGKVSLQVPLTGGYVLSAEDPSGEHPLHEIYLNGHGSGYDLDHTLVTAAEADRIAEALGASLDPSTGILAVGALWLQDNGFVAEMLGATVTIDANHGISVVQDPGSEAGWTPGDTVPATADLATVAFGGITPGDVRVTLSPPEAVGTCGAFPSELEDAWSQAVPVKAGQVTSLMILCTRAEAARQAPQTTGGAASAALAPFALRATVHPATTPGAPLRLEGALDLPAAGGGGAAQYTLTATPALAPTQVSLRVTSGADTLTLTLDTELDEILLGLGEHTVRLADFPDGTLGLDTTVYGGLGALVAALAADTRLASLTEAHLVGWMVALDALRRAARTRALTTSTRPRITTSPELPGRVACARFGLESDACRLWPHLYTTDLAP